MRKIIGQMLLGVVCVLSLLSLSFAIEKKQQQKAIETDRVPTGTDRTITDTNQLPPATLQYKYSDLAVEMTLTRDDNGIVTIRYKVCNVGKADFASTPQPSSVRVSRVSVSENRVLYYYLDRQNVMNLAHGACTEEFTTTYTIPLFIAWGNRTPRAGECQADELDFWVDIRPDTQPSYNNVVTQKVPPHLYQCVQ